MNLFELFVKIGVDDQASSKISNITKKLGNGLATAAKIGTAAVSAAAAGITALTTAAVNNYAEYEQLVGGAELLFGDAFDFVQQKSLEAYKNVQMSQNKYLQQINGFATGLKTALEGNEQAAAELADRIITAEADIVAATGNTQEAVQNAFNGIMKSNYTMLDNLQLGITPTKEGFQEVIDKVNAYKESIGEATNYQIDNLADAQSALLDYIEMQGLSGYASMEAANTIAGSVASMKAAWTNLVTGLADGNANIGELIDNLVTTIIGDGTENNLGVLGNILPAIETALKGASTLVKKLVPEIISIIPNVITENLPILAEAAISIIKSIVNTLTNPTTLVNIINAGLDLLLALVDGLLSEESINSLIGAAFALIDSLLSYLMEPDNILKLYNTAVDIVVALVKGLLSATTKLQEAAGELVSKLWEKITSTDWVQLGKDIISSLLNGLKQSWDAITGWFSNAWDNLFNSNETGSTVNEKGHGGSGGSFKSGLDYVPYDGFVATLHKGERVLTAEEAENYSKAPRVQVIQNIYSQAQTAADLMEEALYEQERAVLMGV